MLFLWCRNNKGAKVRMPETLAKTVIFACRPYDPLILFLKAAVLDAVMHNAQEQHATPGLFFFCLFKQVDWTLVHSLDTHPGQFLHLFYPNMTRKFPDVDCYEAIFGDFQFKEPLVEKDILQHHITVIIQTLGYYYYTEVKRFE